RRHSIFETPPPSIHRRSHLRRRDRVRLRSLLRGRRRLAHSFAFEIAFDSLNPSPARSPPPLILRPRYCRRRRSLSFVLGIAFDSSKALWRRNHNASRPAATAMFRITEFNEDSQAANWGNGVTGESSFREELGELWFGPDLSLTSHHNYHVKIQECFSGVTIVAALVPYHHVYYHYIREEQWFFAATSSNRRSRVDRCSQRCRSNKQTEKPRCPRRCHSKEQR
ncbi:unnamed protein product, partial [Linum tenue]